MLAGMAHAGADGEVHDKLSLSRRGFSPLELEAPELRK
jgi:hypothetical protein